MGKFLVGSHGVGKSTVLEQIRINHPDYYTTDGLSRPLRTGIHISVDYIIGTGVEQEILNELTRWNYLNILKHKKAICTRSLIDAIVYTRVLYPSYNVSTLIQAFEETKDLIEYLFYIPVEFKLQEDDIRPGDKKFQETIDIALTEFLDRYADLKIIELSGSIEQRYNRIKTFL